MSRKRSGIDLARALGRQQAEAQAAEPVPAAAPAQTRAAGQGAPRTRAPSRAGQTNISGWFDTPVKLRLDELRVARQRALGRRVTQQELLSEAYDDLFEKYGVPEMAPNGPDR